MNAKIKEEFDNRPPEKPKPVKGSEESARETSDDLQSKDKVDEVTYPQERFIWSEVTNVLNTVQLCHGFKERVQKPIYPDPETLPLPDSFMQQIMRMPRASEIKERLANKGKFVNDAFKIVSPLEYVLKTKKEIKALK